MFIITEDPVKKNGAKVTEDLRIVVWNGAPYFLTTGLQRAPDWTASIFNIIPSKQHLYERRLGLPVRGYNSSCG
jgi:hypothetical protein